MAPPASSSDNDFGTKLDMCLTDGIVKSGAGVLLGALSSLLFFRRRRWPIIAGAGIGLGIAYSHCEIELNAQCEEDDTKKDGKKK